MSITNAGPSLESLSLELKSELLEFEGNSLDETVGNWSDVAMAGRAGTGAWV